MSAAQPVSILRKSFARSATVTRDRRRPRAFASAAAVAVFCGAQLPPSSALAEPPLTLTLDWQAPPECADRSAMLRRVGELLGSSPGLVNETQLNVHGRVHARPQGYELDLAWGSHDQKALRRLEAASCAELSDAAALMIALALAPDRAEDLSGPGSASPASSAPEPGGAAPLAVPTSSVQPIAPTPPASRAPSTADNALQPVPATPSGSSWAIRYLRTGFAGEVGMLPSFASGTLVGLGLSAGKMNTDLQAHAYLPQEASAEDGGGRFWLFGASGGPCLPLPLGGTILVPCAVLELDVILARGIELAEADTRIVWVPRAGVGLDWAVPVTGRLALTLGATLLLAPLRPSFVVEDDQLVHRPGLVGGRFFAGLLLAP